MQFSRISLCAVVCSGLLVSACQPGLNSELPTGQGALDAIAVSEADTINALILLQPQDVIDVRVFQEDNLTVEKASIDQAGNVSLPLIGEIRAAGLSSSQLAASIEAAYAKNYLRDPHVNVILVESAPRVVSVEGQVAKPGVFEVQRGYTLLSALALAGSPTDTARLDEVLIFRDRDGERLGGRFDLTDVRAGRSIDPLILPGDTIVVGYSRVRGAYLDFLKTAPIIGSFARY